jgi:adenylate cyclase, class 2
MHEIEVKIRVENLESLVQKLAEQGCVLSAPIHQHDAIYSQVGSTDVWETSKQGQTVMRIRREGIKAEFNLKQQRSNELDNLEYETTVDDPEAVHNILAILGYTPQVEVKKVRRKGKLNGYEICLDEVEELGNFVELEKLTDENSDPLQIQEELLQTLESLGLSRADQELKGYDTQMYKLKH